MSFLYPDHAAVKVRKRLCVTERQGRVHEPHARPGVAVQQGLGERGGGGPPPSPASLEHYNWDRPHSACGGLPPMSRIVGVNNLLARNT